MRFALLVVVLACPFVLHAQADDPLAVTLPSGKVVHFQTEEQKSAFMAARERSAATASAPASPAASTAVAATAAPSAQPKSTNWGTTALDEQPATNGKVNVGAPTFTADYYMLAPETWAGKQITLSVADVRPINVGERQDGMQMFRANTYGIQQSTGAQRHGGYITILATPNAASRIANLAGSRIQYTGAGVKMALIKGQFTLLNTKEDGGKRYGLIVSQ